MLSPTIYDQMFKKKSTISDTTITSKHDGTHLVTPQALIQSDITAAANLSIV